MSNKGGRSLQFPHECGTVSLHLWILVERVAPACARQSQQSCALWARLAALAVLVRVLFSFAKPSLELRSGGAYRDRTDDLLNAIQSLSQLS